MVGVIAMVGTFVAITATFLLGVVIGSSYHEEISELIKDTIKESK